MATAIELLFVAPIWPKYLSRLEIGATFVLGADPTTFRILIPSSSVHTRQTFDYTVPPESSRVIECYVNEFRTRLCDEPSLWLFPGRKSKTPAKLSEQISRTIEHATGLRFTPLTLRYLVGALFLMEGPDRHEVVRQALGHRTLSTTRLMYRDLSAMLASERFDALALSPKMKV
jgi:integrase